MGRTPAGYERQPKTIEAMLESCELAEMFFPDGVPYEQSVMPTHEWCVDLCRRILALEQAEAERQAREEEDWYEALEGDSLEAGG